MTEPVQPPNWNPPTNPATPPVWTTPVWGAPSAPSGSGPSYLPPPPPGAGTWPGGPTPEPPRRPSRTHTVRNLIAVAVVAALFGVLLVFAGADLSRRSETNGAGSSAPQLVPQLIPPGTVQPPATSGNGNNPNSGTNPNNGTNPNSGSNSNGGANSDNGTTPAPAPQSAATSKLDVGVVDIDTRLGYQDARAAGTGMIITSSGEVLTNTHVISGATTIRVTVVSTGKSYDATVLGSDKTHDVALLKLKGASNLATVKLGDSAKVEQGDTVTAVGNAGGVGGIPSVSSGTVTGLNQSITVADEGGGDRGQLSGLIQTNASLEPGDSGGPLYNAAGEVIGMDTAADAGRRFQSAGSESYAIAIDNAEAIVKDIQEQRGSSTVQIGPRGFLGVSVDDNNGSNGPFGGGGGGTSETAGAVVADVLDGTPAAKAGLQAGDVITAIDGKIVDSNSALTDRLHGFNPGDKVKVTWTDTSGQSHTTTITLADGPVA